MAMWLWGTRVLLWNRGAREGDSEDMTFELSVKWRETATCQIRASWQMEQ